MRPAHAAPTGLESVIHAGCEMFLAEVLLYRILAAIHEGKKMCIFFLVQSYITLSVSSYKSFHKLAFVVQDKSTTCSMRAKM